MSANNDDAIELEKKIIELKKLGIELDKKELELDKEKKEFELSKKEETLSQNFFNKYGAVLIPAAVSLAAALIALGQVWPAFISKDKELGIQDSKNIQDSRNAAERTKREFDIGAAKFVVENSEKIFHGKKSDKEIFATLIQTLYPPSTAYPLLLRLQKNDDVLDPDNAMDKKGVPQSPYSTALAAADILATSIDQSMFLEQSGRQLNVHEANSARVIATAELPRGIQNLTASFSSDKIVTVNSGGAAYTWDITTKNIWSAGAPKMGALQSGINLYAGDFKKLIGVKSATECSEQCSQESRCVAMTFVKEKIQGALPVCYLKSKVPPARIDGCCSSAIKNMASR